MKTTIVPFFIANRGCPHRCVFCDQQKTSGAGVSLPSQQEILEKISAYRRTSAGYSVEAAFYGGSFTCLPLSEQQRLLHPLQPLLASGDVHSVRVSTRPDALDGEIIALLRSLGVQTVEVGAQSMDDGVLIQAERGHSAADVERSVSLLKSAGLAAGVQLMPGLPGDDRERSLASLSRVLELQPDFIRIYPTVVIAGTPLASRYADGDYRPLSLEAAVNLCKVMLHRALSSCVPVIRMGLQPTTDLDSGGVVLAGPYHPAFRQLVESELCYDLLKRLTADVHRHSGEVTVTCSPSRVADVVGHGRANMNRLFRDRGISIAAVRGDAGLSPMDIAVKGASYERSGTILQDLSYDLPSNYMDACFHPEGIVKDRA